MQFTPSTRVLFIGDSITDCGRNTDPEKIGAGYPRLVRDYLRAKDPAGAPEVINVGISGNKVTNLRDRWQADVLNNKPDVLSIKIGINDVWHALGGRNQGIAIEPFTATYRQLLTDTRRALPDCQLILCEPTVIQPPSPAEGNELLKPYVKAVGELADEFDAILVPLHAPFLSACQARPDLPWAPDGVHPSSTGHMLIAREWLRAVGVM